MNNIHILDCTLRDGGYCNNWNFGFDNVKKIINGLIEANIEIIECGFLTNKEKYNSDITKYNTLDEVSKVIPNNRDGKIFVVMINYGEYNVDDLPVYDGTSVDGIRVAFNKKNRLAALDMCNEIKEKGYLVFVQAMVSLSYNDDEFLDLISLVNKFRPYAFYIVDSFGMMNGKDLTRLFYMVEHNLIDNILIGFHSHNNMQLAFSNAQRLVSEQTRKELIIDSSIYGMGRGAGNLNTELFVEYLNETVGKDYYLKPILIIIDEILNDIYQRNNWGYSLPNYISATHNAHPNYASYLDNKKTLTIDDMNDIFDMMEEDKKITYDRQYIEKLYIEYMEKGQTSKQHESVLREQLRGKNVLLIAPGKSSIVEKDKISKIAMRSNVIAVSINHEYECIKTDYIFLSNLRRFRKIGEEQKYKCIVTSNIHSNEVFYQVKYSDLLNNEVSVADNAGLMAIKFFSTQEIDKIYLAGFDGYSHDVGENYGNKNMTFIVKNDVLDTMNSGMSKILKKYSKIANIEFVTTPRYFKV
ncbi:MAG: aldolase catalytic domain-containing protein [Lachnospiraceae bacterium]|nr:aldolase catalytic domain-containing protein [Lachnospiraceae bacterium]